MNRPRFWEDTSGRLIPSPGCGTDLPTAKGLPALIPYRSGTKWGFCDRGRNIVVHPDFDEVALFSGDGLARVKVDGNYGYVDREGAVVAPATFPLAASFKGGLASVQSNGKWGYLDTRGSFAIRPVYDFACSFEEGLAAVQIGHRWGYVGGSGT